MSFQLIVPQPANYHFIHKDLLRNYYMFPWNQGKYTYDGFLSKLLIKKRKKKNMRLDWLFFGYWDNRSSNYIEKARYKDGVQYISVEWVNE